MHNIGPLKDQLKSNQHTHIKIGFSDIDGLMLGKYLSKEKFLSALDHGFSFCDVALGWDIKDQLYDNTQFTGWHSGYPDASMRILADTHRSLPFEQGIPFFLAEFSGEAEAICPRGVLRRVLKLADQMGFEVNAAFEYEFFVFNETLESAKAKGFQNLDTLTQDWCGYSMLRTSVHSEFHQGLLALCEAMNCPIEGLHTETGPGVIEAALQVDQGLAAADKAALFKTLTKIYAQRQQLLATFMAKWSEQYPGQSGHIHISLIDKKTHQNAFHDPNQPQHISALQTQFVAGVQKLLPEALALIAPTINSYKRLIPGFWAPTESNWGIENRTTAIRVIPGSDKAQRVEIRVGSADANPYLALAAALSSGLAGIQQQWQPSAAISGNAYAQSQPNTLKFPTTLTEASTALKTSETLRDMLGQTFVEHFTATRDFEVKEYQKHISQWELERYLELI
jgi:glutamine synthetase